MRRGLGMAGLQQRQAHVQRLEATGEKLAEDRAKHIREQLAAFKSQLEDFAAKHKDKINKDPEFRRAFAQMTTSIGVDPLASSKGFWAQTLGLGDWYYELGVQAVEACMRTRAVNGGVISLAELTQRVSAMRGGHTSPANEADVKRALDRLAVLGGYRVVSFAEGGGGAGGGERGLYVVSTAEEMDDDQFAVLRHVSGTGAAVKGAASVASLAAAKRWEPARARRVLDKLLRGGVAWLDAQASREPDSQLYYFPAVVFADAKEA